MPRVPYPPGLPWRAIGGALLMAPSLAAAQHRDATIDRYADVFPAIYACYRQPPGAEGMEVTIVFTFNRKGEVFGKPRISYAKLSGDKSAQQAFVAAALQAIADCTPLKFADALGGAVAGRPFSIRFLGQARQRGI